MNKIKSLILTSFILLFIGCKSESKKTNKPIPKNPVYSSEVENRIKEVINNLQVNTSVNGVIESKTLVERMEYYHTPAVSIAVVNNGEIEWARGFGKSDLSNNIPADTETLFQAGSVSKPVFALTVMKLYEEGLIDLDKDVNEYLTSWKIPKNGSWQPKITLRQLLSHTAGLNVHGFPGYLENENIPSIPQILNGEFPSNTPAIKVNILPSTNFRYSGGGTTVAQLTFTDLLKKSFPDLTNAHLFNPLNLKNSTYNQPLPSKMKDKAATAYPYKYQPVNGRFHIYPEMAAAGLWTTPTELATIMIEIQKGLHGNSNFIKKKTLEEMMEPQKMANMIGIGFFLEGKDSSAIFSHNGWDEGFIAQFRGYKNIGKGIVIMLNSNEGQGIINEIMSSVAKEYEYPDYVPNETKFQTVDESMLKYTGTYGEYKLDYVNEKLFLACPNQEPLELKKTTDGIYKNEHMNFKIEIKNNQLELTQAGKTKIFDKK